MAGSNGQTTTPLNILESLEKNPFAFDFFRAVRLVECHFQDHPRIGFSQSAAKDPLRFQQNPSLNFAPSSLEGLDRSAASGIPRLLVRFFGMFGPNGPLPPHLTEYALEREVHHRDPTFRGFCNVFNHRLISFFYRAWSHHQKALDLDRPAHGRFTRFVGSFFGMGMESLEDQDSVQDWAKLYFAGRLASPARNAEGLEAILEEYFEVHSEVVPFVGRWMNLPSDSICRLGETPYTGQLGLTAILGERIWECQLNFRLKLGPMKLRDYERMLPHGEAFRRLQYWILNYCGEHFFWDAQLILRADEVPSISLGQSGRLGWTTWLKTKPFDRDAADLLLIPPHRN